MKRYFLQLIALLLLLSCREINPLDKLDLPEVHRQVVLVTTASWSDSTGTLQRFYRSEDQWKSAGQPVEVMVGRNGLAWGRGLHQPQQAPKEKMEGDGKAPAGIFRLSGAFGYGKEAVKKIRLPYRQATPGDYWIDDVGSPQYNQWVTVADSVENDPHSRWDSFERMRREDGLYEFGILVDHNTSPIEKGKGSAIFIHIWRGSGMPTAGCTAMPRADLLEILGWLNEKENPVLIQLPLGEFDGLGYAM